MSENRYVEGDTYGWLKVKLDSTSKIVSLPEYLKVEFKERKEGRDHFEILEGVHKGERASVKAKANGQSHLGTPMPTYQSAARVTVDITKKELTYGGKKAGITVHGSKPPKIGTHNIQIPDFPHGLGRGYLGKTKYALSWFFLGRGHATVGTNDRYLHTGSVSAGCVTVDPAKWTDLYKYLILRRARDGMNVGKIHIKR